MKLDYETIIEIEDYIQHLDETVGLKIKTVQDIAKAIHKYKSELKKLRVADVSICACGSTKYYSESYKDVTKYYCSKCHDNLESKH